MGVIYNIATAAELTTALGVAVAGDTLRLAAGNYGTFSIRDRVYAGHVRIESADPNNRAQFDGLTVRESSNLTLVNLNLGRTLNAGEPDFTTLNTIRESQNITLTGVKVHGSLDNNPQNDGRGLIVNSSSNVLVENSLFTELHRGLLIGKSNNVVVRDTEFRVIRSDGINVSATEGLVITRSKFSDFRPIVPDHGDAIQFFNTGQTKGSKNITIENNEILITNYDGTEGTGTQGIFISDPLEFGYENILIRNNVLFSNGAFHGINIDGGRKVQITNNTVLSKTTDTKDFWIRLGASDGVIVDGNVADNFIFQNVTKLFQGQNSNLKLFPQLASQVPNLLNPLTADDLVTDGIGYTPPAATAVASPVSSALALALSGTISPSQSQQAFKPVPIDDAVEAGPVALSLAQVFAAAPVFEPSPSLAPTFEAVTDYGAQGWTLRDMLSGNHFAIA